jgi:hypothetical protein
MVHGAMRKPETLEGAISERERRCFSKIFVYIFFRLFFPIRIRFVYGLLIH